MKTRFSFVLALVAAACMLGIGSTDLFAQRFQTLHGGANFETGRYGVQPILNSAGGGYIAVGSSNSPTAGARRDVYVVRLSPLAGLTWSVTVDINALGGDDMGSCVVECANGDFAITGILTDTLSPCYGVTGTNQDVFFLRLSSAGNVVCSNTYGTRDFREGGMYIRECRFGNTAFGTAPGDFVISGYCQDSSFGQDAYLLRVKNCGALVWDAVYGGNGTDYFEGCLEAQFSPAASNGDIIAVGGSNSFNTTVTMNGFMVRVSPNNGLIGAAPQNGVTYGGNRPTQFWTVEELRNFFPGHLVAVGSTDVTNTAGATSRECYVLRTTNNPCVRVIDRTHGDVNIFAEEYYTVKEIRGAPSGTPLGAAGRNGNIVISGYTYARNLGPEDAIMHELNTTTLLFAAGGVGYKIYGTATRAERSWSLNPVVVGAPTQGFILCGYMSPFGIDPSQLYLIKTDVTGSSNCNWVNWQAGNTLPNYAPFCINPWKGRIGLQCFTHTLRVFQPWITVLCFVNPKESISGEELSEESGAYLFPNPITQGTTLTVQYTMPAAAEATIVVSDLTGKTLFSATESGKEGKNVYELATETLVPGTYMVTVKAEGVSSTQKIVVSGR